MAGNRPAPSVSALRARYEQRVERLTTLGPRAVPVPAVAAAAADRGIGPADYPGEKLDTIAGSIFCNVISIFIIVATAAAIHVRAPLESAKQADPGLAPVAGRVA